jgi:hypothetical protein
MIRCQKISGFSSGGERPNNAPHSMRSVLHHIELLFLEAVFHVTTGAVKVLVEGGGLESQRLEWTTPIIGQIG